MARFLNQPSLASGMAATIAGMLLLVFGAILMAPGIRMAMAGLDGLTVAFLGAGLAVIFAGGTLVGLGVRAVMRFERRLLVAVASRGRLQA